MNPITNKVLLAKHGSPCPYCLRTMNVFSEVLAPTRDHIRPRSRFNKTELLIVCMECNLFKANKTLAEFIICLAIKNEDLQRILKVNTQRLKTLEYLTQMGLT